MTKKRLGVAVAGLGFGETVHLQALSHSNSLEPVAIWHHRNERLEAAKLKHEIEGYTNWSQLLDQKEIEAIVIATPPAPRFQLAKEALEAGKHLLLEKPVAINSTQIRELQRLALERNLSVAVDFEYRAVPLFIMAKRLLESEIIGDISFIKLDWLMSSRANRSRPWNWYSQKENGGGVIGALGTHAFDMLHWFFGVTKSVSGLISTSIKERPINKGNEYRRVTSEDIAIAQLEIEANQSQCLIPAQVNLSSVSLSGRGFWLEIYGSDGTIILGSSNQKDYVHGFGLWLAEGQGEPRIITPDVDIIFPKTWSDGRIAPVERIHEWWFSSISTGSPIVPGLLEGLSSQRVCEKLISSNETGQRISIK